MCRPSLSGCCVAAAMVFLLAFGFGFLVAEEHWKTVRVHETYNRSTNCFITGRGTETDKETTCGSMTGRDAACVHHNVTYKKIFVSYVIDNGTHVNSSIYTRLSDEYDHFKIGSHDQCFYNPQYVTAVVSEVSDGKDKLLAMRILFGIALAILLLLLGCAAVWIIRKMKEQRPSLNQDSFMTMTMLRPITRKDQTDETIYVEDR